MLIKFALRHNLIYPLLLIICQFIRQEVVIILAKSFEFGSSLAYIPLAFSGEFLGGLLFYLLQKLSFKRKRAEKDHYFMSIKLIQDKAKNGLAPADNYFKIAFLIFVTTFIDLAQYIYWAVTIPKFQNISTTLTQRTIGLSTIAVAIYYIYLLKLSIYKHHIFSLIVIGICLVIILGSEFLFQKYDIFLSIGEFFTALALIIFKHICAPLVDLLEKYLFEYDYMNPFLVLMFEGLIGIVISCLSCLNHNYFDDFKLAIKKNEGWDLVLFIFLIIFYIILSALRNSLKMITTKIYSPMIRNLTDNVLTPLYFVVNFFVGSDLQYEKRNYLYFTINLILSLIILFSSFIYSEFIVLFCCGLETNTHDQISKRAAMFGFGSIYELEKIDGESEASDNYSSHTDNETERTECGPFVLY